jgi:hypothetical protein
MIHVLSDIQDYETNPIEISIKQQLTNNLHIASNSRMVELYVHVLVEWCFIN